MPPLPVSTSLLGRADPTSVPPPPLDSPVTYDRLPHSTHYEMPMQFPTTLRSGRGCKAVAQGHSAEKLQMANGHLCHGTRVVGTWPFATWQHALPCVVPALPLPPARCTRPKMRIMSMIRSACNATGSQLSLQRAVRAPQAYVGPVPDQNVLIPCCPPPSRPHHLLQGRCHATT